MDTATWVQNLDETVCISHHANTLGKGMNPTILSLNMGKIVGQTELFNLGVATNLEEENFGFKLRIKNYLYSYPACERDLVSVSLINGISTFVGYLMSNPSF